MMPTHIMHPPGMEGQTLYGRPDGSYSYSPPSYPKPKPKTGGTPRPVHPQPTKKPPVQRSSPSTSRQNTRIQTGFNADDQAINTGSILSGLNDNSRTGSYANSADGQRGHEDFAASQAANEQAQLRRGIEQQNAQQNMKEQAMQSQLLQQAMSNHSQITSDMARRATSQIGLASGLQQSMLGFAQKLQNGLLG